MNGLKQTLGRTLRGLYLKLPVSWEQRLRLKQWIFKVLAPFLKDTNAYKRWVYFRRDDPYASLNPIATTMADNDGTDADAGIHGGPDTVAVHLSGLYAASTGLRGNEYVEIAETAPATPLRARAIAFYLPQFHPIAENDQWWGRGFTEWTNVSKALPQFIGHYQPRLPGELGFYDLRVKEVMRRQIELAKLYGIEGFCFHYYWFSGRRLLERPLDQFLADDSLDLPFCLCWANENWTRRWDGMESDVLLGQNYTDDNDEAFIRDLFPYLRDPRYIRLDGRPLFIVYRPSLLPDCKRTLAHWRDACRKEGIGEIFIAMVQFEVEEPGKYGFDAALEFPPHKLARELPSVNGGLHVLNPAYGGHVVSYEGIVDAALRMPTPRYPLMRGVFPSWDNEARKPGRGYTFLGSTPSLYRKWLDGAVEYARKYPVAGEESVVFINAWNEWAEGAHLEPDRKYGYAYLDATRQVLEASEPVTKAILVSHDAHPHGAQYLTLNMARELARIGVEVRTILLGPGVLSSEFEKVSKVYRFDVPGRDYGNELRQLKQQGFRLALANTSVSGRLVPQLKDAGFKVVSLIHEQPGVIEAMGLREAVKDIGRHADAIVISSDPVRKGICGIIEDCQESKLVMRPQGLYARSRFRNGDNLAISMARIQLRKKLGVPEDAKIVLSVGYADKRKGVDLLVDIAAAAVKANPGLCFVWLGHWDTAIQDETMQRIRRLGLQETILFPGFDADTDAYYAGADVYALTSREDPFPSVVLESLAVGVPVVAFSGTGGGADLLAKGVGVTVEAFDAESFALAVCSLVADESRRSAMGRKGKELVDSDYSFRSYVIDLLRIGGERFPTISVVVPNYNYARYIRQRLESISQQTFPVYEIIVLDDKSRDESVAEMSAVLSLISPEPRLLVNEQNSGSVFKQWLKGVQLARGEYVWIAEADDLAAPEFLETMVNALEARKEAVFGYCQSRPIDGDGLTLAESYLDYTDDLSTTRWRNSYVATGEDEIEAGFAVKNTILNVSSVLFRRHSLLRVLEENLEEILSYRIAGDWMVYLHLLEKGSVLYQPEVLNVHRRHTDSVTRDTNLEQHYREVVAVQAAACRMFNPSPRVRAMASLYQQALRRQFGMEASV